MKNIVNFLFLVGLMLAACSEPDYPTPTPSATSLTSRLTVVHTLVNGPRVKVKMDNRITEKDTLRYEKAPDGKFYNTITLSVPAGPNRLINVANFADNKDLVTDRYNATASTNNTSFISENAEGKASVIRVSDDLTLPDVGFVKVRFFNFSRNAGEVKVTNVGASTTIFSARKFNETSRKSGNTTTEFNRFSSVAAATYSYEVRSVETDEILLNIENLKLDSKGIYTIYLKGLVGGTGDEALGYAVIKH